MPFFKTTYNILSKVNEDELFNPNWFDSDKVILPPKKDWDYKREMKIEDVDIWEVLYQASGGYGCYAAWAPHAEFYLLTVGWQPGTSIPITETYYGSGAQQNVQKRMLELGMPFHLKEHWVEPEDLWKYSDFTSTKLIFT